MELSAVADPLWVNENARNTDNSELFKSIIREAYDPIEWVGVEHHMMFQRRGEPAPDAIPSADSLIFSHYIAQKVWGAAYKDVLTKLALEPVETRDALLHKLYNERNV
jgi:hypothetical protein